MAENRSAWQPTATVKDGVVVTLDESAQSVAQMSDAQRTAAELSLTAPQLLNRSVLMTPEAVQAAPEQVEIRLEPTDPQPQQEAPQGATFTPQSGTGAGVASPVPQPATPEEQALMELKEDDLLARVREKLITPERALELEGMGAQRKGVTARLQELVGQGG